MQGAKLRAAHKRVAKQLAAIKRAVAKDIGETLWLRGISQAEASVLIGEQQSQVSLITNLHLRGFSLERLLRARALIGAEIEVEVVSSAWSGVTYTKR